jgi:molybdate transport system substrate-binding protein
MHKLYLLCVVAFGVLLTPISSAQQSATVTVYAAASVKEALDELASRFQKHSGSKVIVSYAGSPLLARQIEKGAPADLFISADTDWMDYLERRKALRPGTRVDLLSNRIVLIAPADSKVALKIERNFKLAEALGASRMAMADPDSVPAGKYGEAALQSLGVWSKVASRVARAENVRAALALVARGESALGVVYATDAAAEKRVRIVGEFSPQLHPPIVYPAAVLAASGSSSAQPFLDYLKTGAAHEVWQRYGFGRGKSDR